MTVDKAIQRGQHVVTLPSSLLGLVIFTGYLFIISDNPRGSELILLLVSTIAGPWLWWSLLLPRWRLWALRQVDDVADLFSEAVSVRLMWPPGHFFQLTEIKSKHHRNQELALISEKFNGPDEEKAALIAAMGG